jgi:hypothetical protein
MGSQRRGLLFWHTAGRTGKFGPGGRVGFCGRGIPETGTGRSRAPANRDSPLAGSGNAAYAIP